MYVCLCKGITDHQIRRAVAEGADSMRDLRRELGVCTDCGKCGVCANRLLRDTLNAAPRSMCPWRMHRNGRWAENPGRRRLRRPTDDVLVVMV